ncbi:phospholipase D-like domain-containing protein [Caldimonas tepidiphila]|uniref:phospholipase D-like domain-containing protein n=1 Tax=Caldimonas tepidiphila TaxID=2315841 RepID=UPI0013006393|nr:phospholipase D-like domain-containing protein [Caldimonas tepidiphila]
MSPPVQSGTAVAPLRVPGLSGLGSGASPSPSAAPPHGGPAAALQRHGRVLARTLDAPVIPGNRVEVLLDGPATYAAMFDAIDAARDHINLESYTLEASGPGEEMARRLIARRRDGLRVNVLFDAFGSMQTPASYFDAMRAAGVRVCEYNPLNPLRNTISRALHLRDHRKLMIVDGRIGFTGGVNISGVYAAGPSGPLRRERARVLQSGWRDTHVRIEGPVVAEMQRLFISHWHRHSCEPLPGARYYPPLPPAGTQQVGVAAREAGRRRNAFYRSLIGAIDAAQQRVLITVAYFVPTRRLMRSLAAAARRGVEVRMVLPGISDVWAPLHAGRSHYAWLLQAGVHIHERHDAMLHAKTCVIDGVWATVGSSNLDWRSFLHNAEANVVVLDRDFAAELEAVFWRDVGCCSEITAERWQQRGWVPRMQEWLARRFEFFL